MLFFGIFFFFALALTSCVPVCAAILSAEAYTFTRLSTFVERFAFPPFYSDMICHHLCEAHTRLDPSLTLG